MDIQRKLHPLALLLSTLLCAGWFTQKNQEPDTPYFEKTEAGRTTWIEAQELIRSDLYAAKKLLLNARESFLDAAMSQPENSTLASDIAGTSVQLLQIEAAIQRQQASEKSLSQELSAVLKHLKILVEREHLLAQQGTRLIRRHPPASSEAKSAAIEPSQREQTNIYAGTKKVTATISTAQSTIRQMLSIAQGISTAELPTEYDEIINQLTIAQTFQQTAIGDLHGQQINWTKVSPLFHGAKLRMHDAFLRLSDLVQGKNSEERDQQTNSQDMNEESDEDMEWDEDMQMSSDTASDLMENPSIPLPNFTAEEILEEEKSNMKRRAQNQAEQAGDKVEKNW